MRREVRSYRWSYIAPQIAGNVHPLGALKRTELIAGGEGRESLGDVIKFASVSFTLPPLWILRVIYVA
jgi:hypothetical protein